MENKHLPPSEGPPSNEPPADTPLVGGNKHRKRPNNSWIYLAIIGLLVIINGFLFFRKKEDTRERIVVVEQLQQVNEEKEALRKEYEAAIARLDELTSRNKGLSESLHVQGSEIGRTREEILGIMSKEELLEEDLVQARSLIQTLNDRIDDYERRIRRLERSNRALVQTRDSVIETNIVLQEKVEQGKLLFASNIEMKAIDLRRGGSKEKETSKARRVDLIRVIFDIIENRLVESGDKQLLIRIVNPSGHLLSNQALGSGSFIDEEGKTINYSVSKQIHLVNGVPVNDVYVDWRQSAEYEKGNYRVEIFHDGRLIGEGRVRLR